MITGFLVLHQSWFQHQQVIMRMRLKLKTVFVMYFMVSLLGLIYALMQLGKTGITIIITLVIHPWIVHFWASRWFLCAGQRCDCRDHDLSKDQQISQLRGELQKLQEHIKTSELSKKTGVPRIYVITPTYARYSSFFFKITIKQECLSFRMFCRRTFKCLRGSSWIDFRFTHTVTWLFKHIQFIMRWSLVCKNLFSQEAWKN